MSAGAIYQEFDLVEKGLLPTNWIKQIESISEEHSIHTLLDGRLATSREPAGIDPIEVFVVTGKSVKEKLSWLHELYHGKLREFASQLKNIDVFPANDLESSVNINILRGNGSRYEWHVDTNPVTGLLFVTTHQEGDGGELVFKMPNETHRVYPKSGVFITFDAREIPHSVMPLLTSDKRISIPMNYYISEEAQERPGDITDYLYTKSS